MTTPLITTVTEYEEKALELIAKAQEEILGYIKQAVELLDERMPEIEVPDLAVLDQIPTLSEIVNTQFAFSKKLLTNQEKFAKNVVKTVKPLTREGLKTTTKTTKTATKSAA